MLSLLITKVIIIGNFIIGLMVQLKSETDTDKMCSEQMEICIGLGLMMCLLHLPRLRPRPRLIPVPMELSLMIMLGIGYSGPRLRLMHISIGSVHILSVSISV